MSVDQTFHTPSFGDEEFEIPPLTYAPTAAATRCSGQGVYGNQVPVDYLKRKLGYDQICVYFPRPEENFSDCSLYDQHPISHLQPPETFLHPHQQQQPSYHPLHPGSSPQNRIMNGGNSSQFHSVPHQHHQSPSQYQSEMMNPHGMGMGMQYEDPNAYSDSMQQGAMQPPQMPLMQQQGHQNHVMGPPQQMFNTLNQSQLSSQLGLQVGMGPSHQNPGTMNGSPPGSNHNSPGLETSEDSDDSLPLAQLIGSVKRPTPEPVDTTVQKTPKKPKAQKKKKKRDPNEPQKPVSAYALFFRDTQAAIKGQNPNASFGEVSKIVASMWDSLDVESKNNYKKKTEFAKKEYLKALAAYRATLVSKAAVDQSDNMYGNNAPNATPPASNSPNNSPAARMMPMQKSPVLTSVMDSMQPVTNSMNVHPQNQQVWHMSPQHMTNNNSPPHVIQPGNNMMGMHPQQIQPQMSPQQMQSQMSPQQMQQQMSPQQMQSQMSPQQMQQQMSPQMQPQMSPQQMQSQMSPQQMQPQMSPQQMQSQMSPQQQMVMNNRQQLSQMPGNSPQLCNSASNSPSYNQNISTVSSGGNNQVGGSEMMQSLPTCLRNGCSNPAVDSPDWDREYCSSECVVSHCKDVFANWVAQRQVSASPYSTVK